MQENMSIVSDKNNTYKIGKKRNISIKQSNKINVIRLIKSDKNKFFSDGIALFVYM